MDSPSMYLKNARTLLHERKIKEAFQSIDAAIVFSGNSPFYIYQKMKFLFQIGAQSVCKQFILTQLEYLYKNASLYIVCRFIAYYQSLTKCSTEDLEDILFDYDIPILLAEIYTKLLTEKHPSFLASAEKAFVQDNYPLCLDYISLYLKSNDTNNKITYMQAYSYYMLEDYQKSIRYYNLFIKTNPNEATIYDNLGGIYMELGRNEEALEYFQHACELAPDENNYRLHIAECYYISKRYTDAANLYLQLVKSGHEDAQIYFNLSHLYKRTNKKFRARKYLKKARKLSMH